MKTYVLDASALFIFLEKKRDADKVADLFKEALRGRAELLMSSVNYGEVYGVILREHGPDRAAAHMSIVDSLPVRLTDVTPQSARHASEIKIKHRLHYLDSFAASLAAEYKATLVTGDSDFRRASSAISVLWLRN